jgi:glycosyltransferase involved in cell wall biosynthesis
MSSPLVSLVTVCYNAESLIANTLQSAITQSYQHIELVIVDGLSKDHTVTEAKRFASHIGVLISEKDNGIYDAMNKGILAAKGEWIYFLNAGDSFYDAQVLTDIFTKQNLEGIDFIYGKVQTVNEPTGINYVMGNEVAFKDFYFKYPICHQATFTRKEAFLTHGMFDSRLKLLADNKWQNGYFKYHVAKTKFVNRNIAFYDIQGASYHKRMQGYREFLTYTRKLHPAHIYLVNLLLYPIIWAKVKIIRTCQQTSWFKAYRRLKFSDKTAHA